ncbi:hypothetical protein [Knoellia sp. p5-6-4]|uniref:hypothetical protein n=1 Tax=unclassified Knoellia TaxID=2618719 RepID=UPI0031F39BC0
MQPRQGGPRLVPVTTDPGPTAADPHAPPHRVRTTTPTGHTYDSTAPPLLPTRGDPRRAHPHPWRDNVITLSWADRDRLPDLLDSA